MKLIQQRINFTATHPNRENFLSFEKTITNKQQPKNFAVIRLHGSSRQVFPRANNKF